MIGAALGALFGYLVLLALSISLISALAVTAHFRSRNRSDLSHFIDNEAEPRKMYFVHCFINETSLQQNYRLIDNNIISYKTPWYHSIFPIVFSGVRKYRVAVIDHRCCFASRVATARDGVGGFVCIWDAEGFNIKRGIRLQGWSLANVRIHDLNRDVCFAVNWPVDGNTQWRNPRAIGINGRLLSINNAPRNETQSNNSNKSGEESNYIEPAGNRYLTSPEGLLFGLMLMRFGLRLSDQGIQRGELLIIGWGWFVSLVGIVIFCIGFFSILRT